MTGLGTGSASTTGRQLQASAMTPGTTTSGTPSPSRRSANSTVPSRSNRRVRIIFLSGGETGQQAQQRDGDGGADRHREHVAGERVDARGQTPGGERRQWWAGEGAQDRAGNDRGDRRAEREHGRRGDGDDRNEGRVPAVLGPLTAVDQHPDRRGEYLCGEQRGQQCAAV